MKKSFTLRRHPSSPSNGTNGTAEAVLPPVFSDDGDHRSRRAKVANGAKAVYAYICSPTGVSILKCSLAYFFGSLAVLVPAIAGLLGRNDGKHKIGRAHV